MNRCLISFLTLLCTLAPISFSFAQSHQFVIDGQVKDWNNIESQSYSAQTSSSGPVQLQHMAATHDEDFLYLKLKLDKSLQMVGPNDHGAQFYLYLDTDLDSKTGYQIGNMGAELGFSLTNQKAYRNVAPKGQSRLNEAHIRILPAVTSKTYELAISRKQPDNRASLMKEDSIQILFYEANGDAHLPKKTKSFLYPIGKEGLPSTASISTSRQNSDHLRLMSFNVLNNGLTNEEQKPNIQALMQATQPDLLTLNECWDISPGLAKDFMNKAIPGKNWYAVKLDEGNITLSRFPIKNQWQVLPNARLTASLMDLPPRYSKNLLLINAHLPCCDKDEERQAQADALINFIEEAREKGGRLTIPNETPIVVAGDMNLVGKAQQLETLQKGEIVNTDQYGKGISPDWDGTKLQSALGRHTHTRMNYTWLSTESNWPAGKLDYIFYTNSVLNVHQNFTINTRSMPQYRLNQLNLDKNTSEKASDHLPVIADFSLEKRVSSQTQPVQDKVVVKFNNKTGKLRIHFPETKPIPDKVNLYNLNGQRVDQWVKKQAGHSSFPLFNTRKYPKGIYWIQYRSKRENKVKKILILD